MRIAVDDKMSMKMKDVDGMRFHKRHRWWVENFVVVKDSNN